MNKVLLFIAFLFLLLNLMMAQNSTIVLKTNFEGKVEYGAIDSLISKIGEGAEVRIGWQLDFDSDGKSDLEHWIDAQFISVLNGHVFNQIEPIYRQIPNDDIPQILIINSNMKWTAIIGTNGKMLSRYIIPDLELIEDENIRAQMKKRTEIRESIVATIWAIKE